MAKFCLIDFETASACDLKKSGAWAYAEHPTTEILCLGYTLDGAPPIVLTADDVVSPGGELFEAAQDPGCYFIAHNVLFEKRIWHELMETQGWPALPDERWHDIMAACAMKALPLKLERAVKALHLPEQKDTDGTKATLALGRTNKQGYHERTETKLSRVYAYNAQDVRTELGLHRRVRGLGVAERKVWLLDQSINARGVRLDMAYVRAAQSVVEQATKPLLARFHDITGIGKVASPTFKDWLIGHGLNIPNLQKATIDKLLGETDDDDEDTLADVGAEEEGGEVAVPKVCREPLQIRRILGSASVKKLAAMPFCCASDGRAHGLLQYHGAGPGRWSGRLLQPHNFPRPSLKVSRGTDASGKELFDGHDPDQLVAAILTRDAEYVRMLFGEPIEAVASGLRHTLVADEGSAFEVGDFNTIEARIVLALAGARSALSIITDKERDVYCEMAATIFGVPPPRGKAEIKYWKEAKLEWRQTGKNTVLGCGFQMGAKKFRVRYAPEKPIEFAKKCVDAYRQDFAPEVPDVWEALGDAATQTVWTRKAHEAYGVGYQMEDGFLTALLPSGRKLWYYDPQPVEKAMPWDETDIRPAFEYSAWKMGQWKRMSGYGGLMTENVVQALARDLLVNAMFNAESDNHPVILTVHDEMVTEVAASRADAKLLDQYMTTVPPWAQQMGIPVNSECWVGNRYRK